MGDFPKFAHTYALAGGLKAQGQECIYQVKHKCPWYNFMFYFKK